MLDLVAAYPQFDVVGKLDWNRGNRAGRASLSTNESPMRQFSLSAVLHWIHWSSYFPPHDRFGFDLGRLFNVREQGSRVLVNDVVERFIPDEHSLLIAGYIARIV